MQTNTAPHPVRATAASGAPVPDPNSIITVISLPAARMAGAGQEVAVPDHLHAFVDQILEGAHSISDFLPGDALVSGAGDAAFSDDEPVGNADFSDSNDDDGPAAAPETLVDDVKGRSASELAHARGLLLDDQEFVGDVTESRLPEGASIGRHLGRKTITFAKPQPIYRFPTTLQFRQAVLARSAQDRVAFTPDATQCIVKFLFEQHPQFPVQIAPAACAQFVMTGAKEKKDQVFIACKEFKCAASGDGCPTQFYAGFTVVEPEVRASIFAGLVIADSRFLRCSPSPSTTQGLHACTCSALTTAKCAALLANCLWTAALGPTSC